MNRCAACGYALDDHEVGTRKCPTAVNCDCGRPPSEHFGLAPMGVLPTALRGEPCRGQWSEPGRWRRKYAGEFKEPEPINRSTWREIMARDAAARHAAADAAKAPWQPAVVLPPLVPARPPQGPGEFAAGGGRQAKGLGKKALSAGWQVEPWYWKAGDGTEGCAVKLRQGDRCAVVTWERKPGKTWAADLAYAWTIGSGVLPARVSVTHLEGIIAGGQA